MARPSLRVQGSRGETRRRRRTTGLLTHRVGSVSPDGYRPDGKRSSIAFIISSAQRTASAIALRVAETLLPPSNCASLRAARMLAAINSTRLRPSSTSAILAYSPFVRLVAPGKENHTRKITCKRRVLAVLQRTREVPRRCLKFWEVGNHRSVSS